MSKTIKNLLGGASLALGATVALTGTAIAQESSTVTLDQINQYNESAPLAQVNSVFQLRDVSPSDWAFDALRNLVEKYNCIVGYPDGTFRGNRSLSRYEFAAGLNACMQQLEKLIAGGGSDVDAADIARLRKLVQEFEAELASLGARVDDLEGRVGFLEDHQFSTTTKLNGEVIFSLASAFGDGKADSDAKKNPSIDDEITFSDRVRLNFDTSFRADGKDRLRTRLTASNITRFDQATGTDSARLGYDGAYDYLKGEGANSVAIEDLYYRFPVGTKTTAYVGSVGLDLDDIFVSNNPYFYDSGNGALSRFGRYNPATLRGSQGAGVGFNHKFSDKFVFSAAYLADGGFASNPVEKGGMFDGAYSLGAQLAFAPSSSLNLALTYVNGYQPGFAPNTSGDSLVNLSGSTGGSAGTRNAKRPFGKVATSANDFGFEASWKVSPKFNLAGWLGYTTANNEVGSGDAEIWTWAANAALLDVGGKGNVLGFIFGQPPRLDTNPDTSYLAELQYRYKLTDNITITPGAYVILNPNHNDVNDTIWVGALRTTFKF